MSIVVIEGGRRITIEGGHQPQFMYGLDANKSTSPGIGDTYYATDTLRSYKCFVVGTWRWEWQGMNSAIRFSQDQLITVQGTWNNTADAGQSDFDQSITGLTSGGYWLNGNKGGAGVNLDEIKIPNFELLPGTYLIELSVRAVNGALGILEVLHGTSSIGTFDEGAPASAYNTIVKFYYTLSTTKIADLRVRCNGTTTAVYRVNFSRLEITRISNSPVITTLPPTAANDAGAATAGVPIGGLYRTNADPSVLMIRAV